MIHIKQLFYNYHVISNFSFLWEVTETVDRIQLWTTLEKADYLNLFQSEFRFSHEMKMALVIFVSYFCHDLEGTSTFVLLLLDYSSGP